MRKRFRAFPVFGFCVAITLACAETASAQTNLVVYDDVSLKNGFADWGWAADKNYNDTTQNHTPSGSSSLSFSSDASWQGVNINGNFDGSGYDAVLMWVRGSQTGLSYQVYLAGYEGSAKPLANFTGGTIPTSWTLATIPFTSLGAPAGGSSSMLTIQAMGAQAKIFIDDISLRAVALGPLTVSVDVSLDRHAINPHVYGVSHFDGGSDSQLAYPVRRWGGNATTRYNWEYDISNRAFDYLFMNIPGQVADENALPNGSEADRWIDSTRAHGSEPVLTIPTIGLTPKDPPSKTSRPVLWGMSITKYGPQETNECLINPFMGCHSDAGNGCTTTSTPGNCTFIPFDPMNPFNPADTSKSVTPAYFTAWMDHLSTHIGGLRANNGGLKYVILDNEPMLWSSTHYDVHHLGVTYDELWQKSRDSAIAFKNDDPNVKVIGGAAWGWCEYFYSSHDGCGTGTDYSTHGNMYWLPYLLQQAKNYETANGTRIMDYLDVHYYPQSGNVYSNWDASAGTQALRLRCLKSLYDPTYSDESWIGQPINLIPRMKAWIDQYYPGTKLAIGEYNFGDTNDVSAALAQAEALAIFGREGVDMAERWTVPSANTLLEDSFLFYLNYDGAGHKVAGENVRAVSNNINLIGGYSIHDTGPYPNRVYLLLFNKDTASHAVTSTLTGKIIQTANLWRFSTARLASAGSAAPSGSDLALTLPARSATLAVLDLVPPAAPTASNNGPICPGGTLQLSATTIAGATYAWTGPNGFTSALQNPMIAGATAANAGMYQVVATINGFPSNPAATTVSIGADSTAPSVTAPAVITVTQTTCN